MKNIEDSQRSQIWFFQQHLYKIQLANRLFKDRLIICNVEVLKGHRMQMRESRLVQILFQSNRKWQEVLNQLYFSILSNQNSSQTIINVDFDKLFFILNQLYFVQMMFQELKICHKKQFERLKVIVFKIEKNILIDDLEIKNQIEMCLNQLDQKEIKIILKDLNQKFKDKQFMQQLNDRYHLLNQVNYEEQFINFKNQKDQNKLLNLFQQQEFWELKIIPICIKTIQPILTKISKELFFIIIEFIEQSQNKFIKSQLSLLKTLLKIKYFEQNSILTIDEQIILEEFIGSFLVKQMYQLENFIEQNVLFNKKLIQQLLGQNLEEPQYLDQYLIQKLSIYQEKIDYESIEYQLEIYIRNNNDINEIYFTVVIYFWGIYCNTLLQIGQSINNGFPIQDILKQEIILNNGQNDYNQSELQFYFFDRFIQFNQSFKFQEIQQYYEYKLNQLDKINKIEFIINKNNEQDNLKYNFNKLWDLIEQLSYDYLIKIKLNDQKLYSIIRILWINQKQQLPNQIIEFLFNKEDNNINIFNEILQNTLFNKEKLLISDLLTLKIILIYYQSNQIDQNSLWYEPINYQRINQLINQLLIINKLKQEYPNDMKIEVENFNVSLQQQSKDEIKIIVDQWIKEMNNQENFRRLIPFYFNIIKRGESIDLFISTLQNSFFSHNIPSKNLNFKALFQILFNNSNDELKMTLLKYRSQYYPIPLLYQNYNFKVINSEFDLFTLNHFIFYLFPQSYTIINLSFSNQQSVFGKTTLINNTFFESNQFEISDNCEINKNTIDIQIDFPFNRKRKLAIADVHGQIPENILIKILSFFHLWIIQINTEQELEENYQNLLKIKKQINNQKPQICIIIRKSQENQTQQLIQLKIKIQADQIKIIYIQNLDNKQIQHQIYSMIFDEDYQQFKDKQIILKKKSDFLNLSKQFLKQDQINQLLFDQKLILNFKKELKQISINEQNGFLSKQAFPIRNIQYEIQTLKDQQSQLPPNSPNFDYLNIVELFFIILLPNLNYLCFMNFKQTLERINKKINYEILDKYVNNFQDDKLKLINHEEAQKCITIQLFWKKLLQIQGFSQNNLVAIAQSLLQKGESFELLDGESFEINQDFLQKLLLAFAQHQEKVLVIGTLGTSQSGKSTLLNEIFGTQFSTNNPTKGIHFSLLHSNVKLENNQNFNYILLLDTEGLTKRSQDYDKKLVLLILSFCDIILVISKGSIDKQIKSLIYSCLYFLKNDKQQYNEQHLLIWCCNQKNKSHHKIKQRIANSQHVTIGLFMIELNLCDKWSYMKKNKSFSYQASQKIFQIIQQYEGQSRTLGSLFNYITKILKKIELTPDLIHFKTEFLQFQFHKPVNRVLIALFQQRQIFYQNKQNHFLEIKGGEIQQIQQIKELMNEMEILLTNVLIGMKQTLEITQKIYDELKNKIYYLIKHDSLFMILLKEINHRYNYFLNARLDELKTKFLQNLNYEDHSILQDQLDSVKLMIQQVLLENDCEYTLNFMKSVKELIQTQTLIFSNCCLSFQCLNDQICFIQKLFENKQQLDKMVVYNGLFKVQMTNKDLFMIIPKQSEYFSSFLDNDKEIKMISSSKYIDIFDFFKINIIIIEITEFITYLNTDFVLDLQIQRKKQSLEVITFKAFFLQLMEYIDLEFQPLDPEKILEDDYFQKDLMDIKSFNYKQKFISEQHKQKGTSIRKIEVNDVFLNLFRNYLLSYPQKSIKELQKENLDGKQQSYVIFFSGNLLKAKSQNLEDQMIHSLFIYPQQSFEKLNQYEETIVKFFTQRMQRSETGIKTLIFEIIDFIIDEIINIFNSQPLTAQTDISWLQFTFSIIEKIQLLINGFNQQIAVLGIILNDVGQRLIKQSCLIIRFFLYLNLTKIDFFPKTCPELEKEIYEQFRNEAQENYNSSSYKNVKLFVEKLIFVLISDYAKKNRNQVLEFLEEKSKTISSFRIIKILDEKFFTHQIYTSSNIINYIKNQVNFIAEYADIELKQIIHEIVSKHETEINKTIKQTFENLEINIIKLQKVIDKINKSEAYDYFEKPDQECEFQLFKIVFSYLQGQSDSLNNIKQEYKVFFQPINLVKVFIPNYFSQGDVNNVRIKQIKPFLKELKRVLNQISQQKEHIPITIEIFKVHEQITNLKKKMIGCTEVCPICNRKCDQECDSLSDIKKVKHACENGHQIGINQNIIINIKDPLSTCEKLQNHDKIYLVDINYHQNWQDFKINFPSWDFGDEKMAQEKIIVQNFWQTELDRYLFNIREIKNQRALHLIFAIDDSQTMIDNGKWHDFKKQILILIKQNQNQDKLLYSKLSLILFGGNIRIKLNCENIIFLKENDLEEKLQKIGEPMKNIQQAYDMMNQQIKIGSKYQITKTFMIVHSNVVNEKYISILQEEQKNIQNISIIFYTQFQMINQLKGVQIREFNKDKFQQELANDLEIR